MENIFPAYPDLQSALQGGMRAPRGQAEAVGTASLGNKEHE